MLQVIAQQNMLLYGVAIFGILGVISQIVLRALYERLIRDMENPGAPKGKYMKQLKQKYSIYKRTQSGADSINIFIQKSLMEYRCMRMNLHTWRRLGGVAFVLCAVLGIGGYYLTGLQGIAAVTRQNYLWSVLASALLLCGIYGVTDTGYRRKFLETGLKSLYTNNSTQSIQEVDLSEMPVVPEKKTPPVVKNTTEPPRKRSRVMETQAQRDKRELKENLAKLKEGISETAAATERSKERNTEILKQMDPTEQERVIREVLKEFLS